MSVKLCLRCACAQLESLLSGQSGGADDISLNAAGALQASLGYACGLLCIPGASGILEMRGTAKCFPSHVSFLVCSEACCGDLYPHSHPVFGGDASKGTFLADSKPMTHISMAETYDFLVISHLMMDFTGVTACWVVNRYWCCSQ